MFSTLVYFSTGRVQYILGQQDNSIGNVFSSSFLVDGGPTQIFFFFCIAMPLSETLIKFCISNVLMRGIISPVKNVNGKAETKSFPADEHLTYAFATTLSLLIFFRRSCRELQGRQYDISQCVP